MATSTATHPRKPPHPQARRPEGRDDRRSRRGRSPEAEARAPGARARRGLQRAGRRRGQARAPITRSTRQTRTAGTASAPSYIGACDVHVLEKGGKVSVVAPPTA